MDLASGESKYKTFISKIYNLPFWLKQVIYIGLKDELESALTKISPSFVHVEDCLQLYVPKITFLGKKELEAKAKGFPADVYKFLEESTKGLSIIEITTNNFWSLAECCSHFVTAVRAELVDMPKSNCVYGTALYMSGTIRLGEYFVKLGKISIEELDKCLRSQQQIETSTGEKKGMGEVLLSAGLIPKSDFELVLHLKEESMKRTVLDSNYPAASSESGDDISKLKEKISQLTRENELLREQLRKIFNVHKK